MSNPLPSRKDNKHPTNNYPLNRSGVLITAVLYIFTAWNRRCLPRFLPAVKSEFDDVLRFSLTVDLVVSLAKRWIETKKNSPPFLRVSQVFAAKPLTIIYI